MKKFKYILLLVYFLLLCFEVCAQNINTSEYEELRITRIIKGFEGIKYYSPINSKSIVIIIFSNRGNNSRWLYFGDVHNSQILLLKEENYLKGELNGFYRDVNHTGYYKNRKKSGEWQSWKSDMEEFLLTETYKNGILNGKYEKLDYSNKIIGNYKNGMKSGRWTYLEGNVHTEGEYLKEEGNYKKNKKNGAWQYYNSNGSIKETKIYKGNKETGIRKTYHSNGDVKEIIKVENNIYQGEYIEYYCCSKPQRIRNKGQYQNNQKTGEWIYYDITGEIIKIEQFDKY